MDREISGDPVFMPMLADISRRQNSVPVTCNAIAKDMLEGVLDFPPGTRFAYSNVGYCLLGKIVESVAGEPFQAYISRELLNPSSGISYVAGHSIEPLPGESHYFTPGASKVPSAPGIGQALVDPPYGSYSIENMEAFGAWVASPTDVLKFFLAIDGARGQSLLNQSSRESLVKRPSFSQVSSSNYYGLGVSVYTNSLELNWYHFGSQPGVSSLALRANGGNSWVVVFNGRPEDPKFFDDFDQALWRAYRNVSNISKNDLFN
jgi:N-acyl-D-amino-acid deacylase